MKIVLRNTKHISTKVQNKNNEKYMVCTYSEYNVAKSKVNRKDIS